MFDFLNNYVKKPLQNWGTGIGGLLGTAANNISEVFRGGRAGGGGGGSAGGQSITSPLPNEYSRFTMPEGFIGPIQSPQQAVTDYRSSQAQFQPPSPVDTGDNGFGGGGISPEAQSFVDRGSNIEKQVNDLLASFVNPVTKAIQSWNDRLSEFDKNNPFSFDEAQARASSEERLNPYYDATLNEFMTGIRRASTRSMEDRTRVIGELNADASKLNENERIATQEAIRSSEQGYAGSGLFFSGERSRASNLLDIQGQQKEQNLGEDVARKTVAVTTANTRTQEDLALQEARQKRLLGAERTTSLETDISQQKKEAGLKRGMEELAYAGQAPGLDAGTRMSLENQFMQGLR